MLDSFQERVVGICRNYVTGKILCEHPLKHEKPNNISFNPANWREICISYDDELLIWRIEQADEECIIQKQWDSLLIMPHSCPHCTYVCQGWGRCNRKVKDLLKFKCNSDRFRFFKCNYSNSNWLQSNSFFYQVSIIFLTLNK